MKEKSLEMWLGALETLPLVVAAFPFGIVFGALAQGGGLGFMGVVVMSSGCGSMGPLLQGHLW